MYIVESSVYIGYIITNNEVTVGRIFFCLFIESVNELSENWKSDIELRIRCCVSDFIYTSIWLLNVEK